MNRSPVVATALLLALMAAAPAAQAQFGSVGLGTFALTSEDRGAALAAEEKLYAAAVPEVGKIETWRNAASGTVGTVELTQVFEQDGLPCRRLEHKYKVDGQSGVRRLVFVRCQVPGGDCKLF